MLCVYISSQAYILFIFILPYNLPMQLCGCQSYNKRWSCTMHATSLLNRG